MYRLIIVDDEFMMRDGLSNLIKWQDMGFKVDAVLEDGRDAIEWLSENPTDVVLTDLRMTFKSGIDIAKFVYENNLNTKVVIISGYSDFEAAREAICYEVSYYLLKPISVKNIRNAFEKIYNQLKEQEIQNNIREEDIMRYEEMESYLEEQFITNLTLGAIRNNEEMLHQLELINWDKSILDSPSHLFEISLENYDEIQYNSNELHAMIGGMISRFINHDKFFWIRASQKRMIGVIVQMSQKDNVENDVKIILDKVIGSVKVVGIILSIIRIEAYEHLKSISTVKNYINVKKIDDDIISELYDRQQLMMSHVLQNMPQMALELLQSYIDIISKLDIETIKEHIVELFASIYSNIRKLNKYEKNYSQISYAEIFNLKDVNDIRMWSANKLQYIMENTNLDTQKSSYGIIHRAKEYIKQNCKEDIALNDVANHVFLSPVYLSRLFKEETGVKFSEFLIECRITEACKLLKSTNKKVYQICNDIGYSNVKYFYNLFKRKTGCSPSEYRYK